MAYFTLKAYAVTHDIVEDEHPLLYAEALRPLFKHTERKPPAGSRGGRA